MSDTYCYLRLKGEGRDTLALRDELEGGTFARWRKSGITVWGIWSGMFGVGSNELFVVAAAAGVRRQDDFLSELNDAEIVDTELFTPTVRPEGNAPCDRAGLYVFRFFEVDNKDVDEIAELSNEAWTTFENTQSYQAEPQGLFRQQDLAASPGRMLLVTWYDGLDSWQTSRRPAPAATANFMKRRDLTRGTIAYATLLVTK